MSGGGSGAGGAGRRPRGGTRRSVASARVGSLRPPDPVPVPNGWIEIELLDDAGAPAAGARYRVVGSDGAVHEGTLDERGLARVAGLAAGPCKVSFPDLDAAAWREEPVS